jgi:hypothetical protein
MHFTDAYDETGTGRSMVYSFEERVLIDDFNVVKSAGGTMTAVVVEVVVEVSDGNGLQIAADQDQGNDVFECGIEIIAGGEAVTPGIQLVAPSGDDSPTIGEPLQVTWRSVGGYSGGVYASISVDGGQNWYPIAGDPIATGPGETRSVTWIVGPVNDEGGSRVDPVSNDVLVKVEDYQQPDLYVDVSGRFSIGDAGTASADAPRPSPRRTSVGALPSGVIAVSTSCLGPHTIEVYDLRGSLMAHRAATGPGRYTLASPAMGAGNYIVRMDGSAGALTEAVQTVR